MPDLAHVGIGQFPDGRELGLDLVCTEGWFGTLVGGERGLDIMFEMAIVQSL